MTFGSLSKLFCVKLPVDDEYWQRTLEHKAKAAHGFRPRIWPSQTLLRDYTVESRAQDVDSTLRLPHYRLVFLPRAMSSIPIV